MLACDTSTMTAIETLAHGLDVNSENAPRPRVLMCRPEHFTVSYRINPWMYPENPTNTSLALSQWTTLYEAYLNLGFQVDLIDPLPGLPDMVYAANGGFVIDGIAYGAKFHHQERQPEGPAYMRWFADHGFEVIEPREINEGEGDFLLVEDTIIAASGFRSDTRSHQEIRDIFSRDVISLQLVNPSYYHLDTALAVIDAKQIAYLPSAFDDYSNGVLRERYPDAILATEEDAAVLGLNSFSDGHNVIIAKRATALQRELQERGYNPIGVELSELLLGGGGVKCCTLELRS